MKRTLTLDLGPLSIFKITSVRRKKVFLDIEGSIEGQNNRFQQHAWGYLAKKHLPS